MECRLAIDRAGTSLSGARGHDASHIPGASPSPPAQIDLRISRAILLTPVNTDETRRHWQSGRLLATMAPALAEADPGFVRVTEVYWWLPAPARTCPRTLPSPGSTGTG